MLTCYRYWSTDSRNPRQEGSSWWSSRSGPWFYRLLWPGNIWWKWQQICWICDINCCNWTWGCKYKVYESSFFFPFFSFLFFFFFLMVRNIKEFCLWVIWFNLGDILEIGSSFFWRIKLLQVFFLSKVQKLLEVLSSESLC